MTRLDIRLERVVEVTPQAAYGHWLDPAAQRRWYALEDGWIVESEADLRVGGVWRVEFGPTSDERYVEHGVFEELDPPHKAVYTVHHEYPDGREPYTTRVTVTFVRHERGTLLTLLDTGFPTAAQRDEIEGGWPTFLDAFERTLPGRAAGSA